MEIQIWEKKIQIKDIQKYNLQICRNVNQKVTELQVKALKKIVKFWNIVHFWIMGKIMNCGRNLE